MVTGIVVVHINRFVDDAGSFNFDGSIVLGLVSPRVLVSNGGLQLSGGAMVIDNAYTLPISPRLIISEPTDKTLAHELGHKLSLRHGNGVDDDDDDLDDPDEPDSDTRDPRLRGPNLMQYESGTMLTRTHGNQMRSQALRHIPDRVVDPVPSPLANAGVDALGDVPQAERFVDIDTFGVAIDQEGGTTTFYISTAGLLPADISNLIWFSLGRSGVGLQGA
jgi:hypothetical protein